mgnify:CR=1 FL=1
MNAIWRRLNYFTRTQVFLRVMPVVFVTGVAVGVVVCTGTRDEDPVQGGISHLLEHMVFKGTARRSAQEIVVDEVEDQLLVVETQRRGAGTVRQLDLVELNEAFASQSVACLRELELDPAKVNVNGGAIALGHPLGMSGARLMTMLVHELGRREARYGLATMCIGVGQGIATIVERTAE